MRGRSTGITYLVITNNHAAKKPTTNLLLHTFKMRTTLFFLFFSFLTFSSRLNSQACFSGIDYTITPVGGHTLGLLTEDFNLDGRPDLACVDSSGDNVHVLINNGSGGFLPVASYPAQNSPRKIISGDFDGDSIKDLAALNFGSNSISVFMNAGNGTFIAAVNYVIGANVTAFTTADLNGDTLPELICTRGSDIHVLINNGAGVFLPQPSFTCPGVVQSIVAGKFNNDAFYDIVFSTNGMFNYVKLGTGLGTFTAPNYSFITSAYLFDMVAGDFNNDGITDIAGSGGSSAYILTNNGNASFTFVDVPSAGGGIGVAKGDLNNDGYLDVIASRFLTGTAVSVSINNGNGTFYKLTGFSVSGTNPGGGAGVAVADFNGDGKNDIAATSQYGGEAWVFFNTGPGIYGVFNSFVAPLGPDDMGYADFTGDGIDDIVVALVSPTGNLSILPGLGNAQFGPAVAYSNPSGPGSLAIDDYNGDGKLDVACNNTTTSNYSVYLNNGAGGFFPAATYAISGAVNCVRSGDFNEDGFPDLAFMQLNSTIIKTNNGSGVFTTVATIPTSGGYDSEVLDFNSDGHLDIVIASNTFFRILLGAGNGTFAVNNISTSSNQPRQIAVADFNQDGLPDVMTANNNSLNYSLYIGTGGVSFQAPVYFGALSGPAGALEIYDYNGDGFPDFVTNDLSYSSLTIYENDQSGGFIPHTYISPYAGDLLWADVDNNGAMDVIYASYAASSISLLMNYTSTIHFAGPAVMCNASPVTLVASANASSYLWSPGASTNDSLVVTAPGSYSCTITNSMNSCISTSSVNVVSNVAPVASINPFADSVCLNQPPFMLNGFPVGGTYSGPGVSGNSFDANLAGQGQHLVEYIYVDSVGCSDTASIMMVVDVCTGAPELNEGAVSVFPNPTNGDIVLSGAEPNSVVTICNLLGEIISIQKTVGNKTNIEMNNLSDGIYFLQVISGNTVISKKVIKE